MDNVSIQTFEAKLNKGESCLEEARTLHSEGRLSDLSITALLSTIWQFGNELGPLNHFFSSAALEKIHTLSDLALAINYFNKHSFHANGREIAAQLNIAIAGNCTLKPLSDYLTLGFHLTGISAH